MKNIGIVTTWQERGAAYVSKQYENILKDNFNTFIYARGGENVSDKSKKWNGSNVTRAKKIPLPTPMAIDKADFIKWIEKNEIDIVLFNEQQWWPPVIWAKEKGVMCVAYIDYYTEETVPFFEIYDLLLCNTKRHFGVFRWHKGAYYLPWGTDTDLFSKTNNYEFVDEDNLVFFHSSGVSPERKGTRELLCAFEKTTGNSKLIIHTQVDILKKLPTLDQLVNSLIASKRLEIINKTVTAPGLYHLGDVYVYPSRLDGIGLTIAEAIASGLPVIVPDCPPMNEFVDDSTGSKVTKIDEYFSRADGYYWPQCKVSITDLQEKLQWFIDHKNNIKTYKHASRKYAEKNLQWRNNKNTIVNILHKAKPTPLSKELKQKILYHDKQSKKFDIFFLMYRKVPFIFNRLRDCYNVFSK